MKELHSLLEKSPLFSFFFFYYKKLSSLLSLYLSLSFSLSWAMLLLDLTDYILEKTEANGYPVVAFD